MYVGCTCGLLVLNFISCIFIPRACRRNPWAEEDYSTEVSEDDDAQYQVRGVQVGLITSCVCLTVCDDALRTPPPKHTHFPSLHTGRHIRGGVWHPNAPP